MHNKFIQPNYTVETFRIGLFRKRCTISCDYCDGPIATVRPRNVERTKDTHTEEHERIYVYSGKRRNI